MKNKASFIGNLLVVLIAIGCTVDGVFFHGDGSTFFRYYTVLSNLLAALACAFTLPFNVKAFKTGQLSLPVWLCKFKFTGCVGVTVTFLTVFLFLGFLVGHLSLLQGFNFFFHLVSPLLMLAICCALERPCAKIRMTAIFWSVAATELYSVVYWWMVINIGRANGGWPDFYGFNTGGMWPVSWAAMLVAAVIISVVCWKLSGGKKRKRQQK